MQDELDLANNPYVASASLAASATGREWAEIEQLRLNHVKQEADIRAVGWLFYLVALLTGLATLRLLSEVVGHILQQSGFRVSEAAFSIVLLAGVSALFGWCGWGLRGLDPLVRWPTILLVSPALLAVPIGTIIALQIMLLVGGEQGKLILSPHYRQIRDETPHIRAYSSTFRLLVIGLCIAVGIIAVVVWLIDD